MRIRLNGDYKYCDVSNHYDHGIINVRDYLLLWDHLSNKWSLVQVLHNDHKTVHYVYIGGKFDSMTFFEDIEMIRINSLILNSFIYHG